MMMGCSDHYIASNFNQRKLKDFLTDDSNSFSSNSFKCFPTNPYHSTIGNLIHSDLNAATKPSPSRSAFHALINAVKNIHFSSIKSPSILPRSISRKLSKKITFTGTENKETQTKLTLTIKDIIRWKSFRDLTEDESPPLDLSSSPHHCTTTTTTTTGSTCSSNGSSWCDSDFTAEDLPWWQGDNEDGVGKKYLQRVGDDSAEAATKTAYSAVGPKVEQKQQNSPISVIDIKFNLEKWMSMDENACSDREDEEEIMDEVEEKAWQLYNYVKENLTSLVRDCKGSENRVVLDFFRDEISENGHKEGFDNEIISKVKAWTDGEKSGWIGWDKREACVREMDKDGKWSKFDEEHQEMAMEIENETVGLLVDELLVDLFYS